jgi:hypothetical protein
MCTISQVQLIRNRVSDYLHAFPFRIIWVQIAAASKMKVLMPNGGYEQACRQPKNSSSSS